MNTSKPPIWLYLSLLALAAASLFSISYRYRVESRNKAVGIAAEADVVSALSAAQALSFEEGLQSLKAAGMWGLVISEETVAELDSQGLVEIGPGPVVIGPSEHVSRVLRGLQVRFPGRSFSVAGEGDLLRLDASGIPAELVRSVGTGLNPQHVQAAESQGLFLVARYANSVGANTSTVRETLKWAKDQGVDVFLPLGEQVLGRRDATPALLEALEELDLLYASAEFAKIGGDAQVVAKAPERVVRLHAAQTLELDRATLTDAVDRYAKAARERNQRILLLRPQNFASDMPLGTFADLVRGVAKQLHREGSRVGTPHAFEDSQVPRWVFLLIGLLLAPVVLWTSSAVGANRWIMLLSGFVTGVLGAGCWLESLRPYTALLAAVALPITAFIVLDRRNGKWIPLEYLIVSLISLVGGLCVAGLLNGLPYFVQAKQFPGVKAAHFGPMILIGAYFLWRLANIRQATRSPVLWGQAALTLVVLIGLALMATRTGNDSPAAVSGIELKLRALLDEFLWVRPRTKEFLIGHPALIVGIGMLFASRSGRAPWSKAGAWIALVLLVASIGQTSIVNTMCHLHTPVDVSLARIGLGWLLGGIIGGVLWLALRRLEPREGR